MCGLRAGGQSPTLSLYFGARPAKIYRVGAPRERSFPAAPQCCHNSTTVRGGVSGNVVMQVPSR
jgi:hypothetical protein